MGETFVFSETTQIQISCYSIGIKEALPYVAILLIFPHHMKTDIHTAFSGNGFYVKSELNLMINPMKNINYSSANLTWSLTYHQINGVKICGYNNSYTLK